MPRVLVSTDGPEPAVLMDEKVEAVHTTDEHALHQLIERVSWAVIDAYEQEGGGPETTS